MSTRDSSKPFGSKIVICSHSLVIWWSLFS
jgi:hypothetical protein